MAGFYSFRRGVSCSLRSWRVWMRVCSRGVQCCGWVIALRMRCDRYGHGLESPHIRMYLDASLPRARCLGLYEILGGRSPGLRGFFNIDLGLS